MANTYKITIIDYNKLEKITFENSIRATSIIYVNSFAEVIDFLGGRPHKQRIGWSALKGNIGWSALKGNTEYIIQKI